MLSYLGIFLWCLDSRLQSRKVEAYFWDVASMPTQSDFVVVEPKYRDLHAWREWLQVVASFRLFHWTLNGVMWNTLGYY